MAAPKRKTTKEAKPTGARILVVEARFYDDIADTLLAGATRALEAANATWDRIAVPGALEIPGAVSIAMDASTRKKKPYDGVVALGCVRNSKMVTRAAMPRARRSLSSNSSAS
jgi:6,7-dimethyl-8-ribityllumazine synthase